VANSTALGRNKLLNGLGTGDLARLQPNLKHVSLTRGDALHPAGAPIQHVYFPEGGMISILTVMRSGELIETAIIGREGVVGGWVAIDGHNANTQTTVQIEGSAWKIQTANFSKRTMRATHSGLRSTVIRASSYFKRNKARRATLSTPLRRACAVGFCIPRTLRGPKKSC